MVSCAPPEGNGRTGRAPRRRRGVVPNNLRERIDAATTTDLVLRFTARLIAGELDGVPPAALTAEQIADLREAWGAEQADQALALLERVGYGAPLPPRARAQRAHGRLREARLRGVLGKLPRALALRLPTTADTHRSGRNDGVDRWGQVRCSRTLRAAHLGIQAAVGGLWHARAGEGETFVGMTGGELAQLVFGERRVSGKTLAHIHQLLAELETLELRAEVDDRSGEDGSGPSEAHRVPGTGIERVERRLGDRWVGLAEYEEASRAASDEDLAELSAAERANCAGHDTIRVHLEDWFRAEIAHPKRRPVFINFDVWRHLRPPAQRLYAFLQGHHRDDYDDRIYFYLAPPTLYTLGISTDRLDRAAAAVSHDLASIWHADRRYHAGDGFRSHKHAGTKWPAFACDAARRPSAPTEKVKGARSLPKRPACLRGAWARLRRHSIPARASGGQAEREHARHAALEAAKREAELVRQAVQRSLVGAAATTRNSASPELNRTAVRRRGTGDADDEDAD